MLPKRKIIRKQYVRPNASTEAEETAPTSLFDKLKSTDTQIKEEALAYISSMCTFGEGTNEVALLAELVVILYQESTALVHQCLFAIANLCEIAEWVTGRAFQMGLDKGLLQLNSNDKNLLRPIMVLMTAVYKNIPSQFKYLVEGVQQSLTPQHLATHQLDLVLSFLIFTEAKQIKNQLAAKIFEHFNSHPKYKTRSLCLTVLLNNDEIKTQPQLVKGLLNFSEELIGDLNLQKEYITNLVQNKPIVNKNTAAETDIMQQEQPAMQTTAAHPNYEIFIDAVEATDLLLEEILKILEGEEWSDEEIDEEGEEIVEEPNTHNSSLLKQEISNFLIANYNNLSKNANLSFIEGQNIVSLTLRLIVFTLPYLNKEQHYTNTSLCALKAIETAYGLNPPEQIAAQIYISALFTLLKCGVPHQWKKILLNVGQSVLKIKETFKECWLFLLELYSLHFNPQKQIVTLQDNRCLGSILKNLIINIPYLQLEEWRAQAIDTVFDIYSNQQFDQTFMQLGFVHILQAVKARVGGGKKKKFIKEVLLDINRFLEYKKKMIQF